MLAFDQWVSNLNKLRDLRLSTLCTLASLERTGSMNLTAQELGISKPAVSKSISNLEKALGLALLNDDPADLRRKILTAEGKALANATDTYIAELKEALGL